MAAIRSPSSTTTISTSSRSTSRRSMRTVRRPGRGAVGEVAAGEIVGQGHGLDVERGDQAARAEGADELGGHAELGEGGAGHGGGISCGTRAAQTVSGGWTNPETPIREEPAA